ncbi:spore germination protein [Neobacillus sp. NRS-1170]
MSLSCSTKPANIIYAASLKSLGVPYLAPLIPFHPNEWKDTLYRGESR